MNGGSGRWLWELYRRLPPGTVHVAANNWPGAEEFDRSHDLAISRLPLRFSNWGMFGCRGLGEYARALWALRALVRQVRPSVIHCGKCIPEGFLARLLRLWGGPEYWCFAHGEELTLARTSSELRWMTRRALRGARRVIANSRHTRSILVRDWQVPGKRIVVLHPGVDTHKFTPFRVDPEVRGRLGWGDRPVILTVGALQKRKGQDMLIRALPMIREKIPNVLYAVAGEGWEQPYLEGLVAKLGVERSVQFLGIPNDAELVRYYQQCDLFALPNRQVGWDFEGFGIVLLEAQACGKPVLAGASGGTRETMDVPHTGRVVTCESSDDLAKMVVLLLRSPDLRARMGERARRWVVERFDWEALTRQARGAFAVEAGRLAASGA